MAEPDADEFRPPSFCDECEDDQPTTAVACCEDCGRWLCTRHAVIHSNSILSRDHEVVPLEREQGPFRNRSKSDDESKGEMDAQSNGETEFVQSRYDFRFHLFSDDIITRNSKSLIRINLTCASSGHKVVTAIGKCVHLQTLNVCACILRNKTFGTELQKCVKLRSLSIKNQLCRYKSIEMDATLFLQGMEKNTDLLSVNFCDIDIQGIPLVMFLRKCPNLIFVQVHRCIMNIVGNTFNDILFGNCFFASLKRLSFKNNNFGDQGAIALAAGLPQCVNLKVLDLTQNNIGDAGALELTKTLPKNLEQLTLTGNKITGLRFLPLPKNLRELQLDHNKISDVGIFNVVSASQPYSGLQLLDLSDNCITDNGITDSVHMLPLCHDLRVLNLSGNSIKDAGAIALVKVLPDCKNLIKLNLDDTTITDVGANAFLKVVPTCGKLEYIRLYGTGVSDYVLDNIRLLLRQQPIHYAMVAAPVHNITNWNRGRHITFGKEINKLFAAFLLGIIRVIVVDNSDVPDANPEMIEETLECLHYYGLTAFTFSRMIKAGNVAPLIPRVKRR